MRNIWLASATALSILILPAGLAAQTSEGPHQSGTPAGPPQDGAAPTKPLPGATAPTTGDTSVQSGSDNATATSTTAPQSVPQPMTTGDAAGSSAAAGTMPGGATDQGGMAAGAGMPGNMTPPPASSMNKRYPVCSRTLQDNCRNRGGV